MPTQGTGEWFHITQEQINAFADCTEDHQFIHLDEERATPIFGGTIAHGFLTLSMLVKLSASIKDDTPPLEWRVDGHQLRLREGAFPQPCLVGQARPRPVHREVG